MEKKDIETLGEKMRNKAFPPTVITDDEGQRFIGGGMDLRDYFAAKALQSLTRNRIIDDYNAIVLAEDSYTLADAMMETRKK